MIVGIGELLWDLFPDGRKVAGGAPFNFAFHCQQLGHPAAIVSRVGDDALGRELREEVRRLGLTDQWIQTDHEHPTGTVRVTVDAAGQPAYEIVEGVAWDYIADEGLPAGTRAVCYGTLAQRAAVSRATIRRLVHWEPGLPIVLRVLDINLRPPFVSDDVIRSSVDTADWLKLNADELPVLARVLELEPDPGFRDELDEYETLYNPDGLICLTKGAAGCTVRCDAGDFDLPAHPVHVVDTVGAGDAFTAALVCLVLERRPLREAVTFALRYAARVCEHQGGTPRIDRAEVERAAFGSGL